jgi:hypothetical protein
MSVLHDQQMDQLSNLLGQGKLSNAQEIAALLKVELGKRSETLPKNGRLKSFFRSLGQITNQH